MAFPGLPPLNPLSVLKKITGRVEVLVQGLPVLNREGATATGIGESSLGGPVERTPIFDPLAGKIVGVTERRVPATCEVTITDRADVSLGLIEGIKGWGTIIFRARDGGKVYVMNDAWCAGPVTVTAGTGEAVITFIGSKWTETVSPI